ncbi:actin-6-like [Argopecten irradians]|uniref:actin-6-like n=1 Tax=Argopecten irradians TaxID=31199 RepID=UPI003718B40E
MTCADYAPRERIFRTEKQGGKMTEDLVTLVVDNGSYSCKSGFANENSPRAFTPPIVGRPHDELKGDLKKEYIIGDEVRKTKELLSVRYPIEFGVISNWDEMEKLWRYIFYDQLQTSPEDHPVLLTRPPHNPRGVTEKMAEMMFEKFETPALYIAITGALSLLSSGKGATTGLVLDSGETTTHAMRIHEGYCISARCDRVDFAGRNLTSYLSRELHEKGCSFQHGTEYDVIHDIKKTLCCVSENYESSASDQEMSYELPDGTQITFGKERFICPEILFTPKIAGIEFPGIHELILMTIQKADPSLHKDMYNNIVLAGGTTLFPGIADRLTKELKTGLSMSEDVNVIADKNREYSAWLGGSIVGNLSTFDKFCVKKEHYDEMGPALCSQKYF